MSIFSVMHKDIMAIYRHVEITIDGITRLQENLVYDNIHCRLSKKNLATADGLSPKLTNKYTIFSSPEVDLIEGDKVIINTKKKVYNLKIGEVFEHENTLQAIASRNETI